MVYDCTKNFHLLEFLGEIFGWAFVHILNLILPPYCNFLLVIFESIFPIFGLHSSFFLNVQVQVVFYSPVGFNNNILIYWMEI